MFEDSPVKKILFDKLVEMGRLPSNPTEQTMQTMNSLTDSEALKLLRSLPGTLPTIRKKEGGMMNMNEMTRPIGMAAGGDAFEKYLGSKDDNAALNSMKSHPFQTSLFLEMGFDKMFDLLSMLPMMKDGGVVDYNDKE